MFFLDPLSRRSKMLHISQGNLYSIRDIFWFLKSPPGNTLDTNQIWLDWISNSISSRSKSLCEKKETKKLPFHFNWFEKCRLQDRVSHSDKVYRYTEIIKRVCRRTLHSDRSRIHIHPSIHFDQTYILPSNSYKEEEEEGSIITPTQTLTGYTNNLHNFFIFGG